MSKHKEAITDYLTKFESPKIDHDAEGAHIYMERFEAHSLISNGKTFDEFEKPIVDLYKTTFNDSIVMEKFATGNTRTKEQFEATVNLQSSRWQHKYPFAAFVIYDKDDENKVVGYEVIGNGANDQGFLPNTGEVAYLFNKDYHNSNHAKNNNIGSAKKQGVGYECVGGLVLFYGHNLYINKALVNQTYNKENDQFEGGTEFKKVVATSRIDNPASSRLLENLGFEIQGQNEKFGHLRNFHEINFEEAELMGKDVG